MKSRALVAVSCGALFGLLAMACSGGDGSTEGTEGVDVESTISPASAGGGGCTPGGGGSGCNVGLDGGKG